MFWGNEEFRFKTGNGSHALKL